MCQHHSEGLEKIECFVKIVKNWTVSVKRVILDVWQGSEYVSNHDKDHDVHF